ncbi:hypothetical protein MRB53_015940 [Persea americana]|uniref:Uncharacterized protein n=1 Tax=Persea americana TaxID=3435 RepID=A0ACC2M1P1_PERAE|nr:hypothetical protein MRB53_015940 [Persea americana]
MPDYSTDVLPCNFFLSPSPQLTVNLFTFPQKPKSTKSRKIPKKQLVEEEKDCCLISLTGGALLPGSTEP